MPIDEKIFFPANMVSVKKRKKKQIEGTLHESEEEGSGRRGCREWRGGCGKSQERGNCSGVEMIGAISISRCLRRRRKAILGLAEEVMG